MAKALIVTLRDEVVNLINKKQGGWAVQFEAKAKHQPKLDFEALDTVQVQVWPFSWTFALDNRSAAIGWKDTFIIRTAIGYRADPKAGDQPASKWDEYLKLVEEITDFWKQLYKTTLADCSVGAVTLGGGTDAPYFHAEIETQNTFTSVIDVTFWKYR